MNKLFIWMSSLIFFASLATASLVIGQPASGSISGFESSPEIMWSGCDADSYLLQIATDESFSEMLFQKVVVDNFYKLDFNLDSGLYYFKVHSIGSSGDFSCISAITTYELIAISQLGVSFHKFDYANTHAIKVVLDGPIDAQIKIDITSSNGFHLPIHLDDLSNPSFDVVLDPDIYVFKATSTYLGENLFLEKLLDLSPIKPVLLSATGNNLVNASFLIQTFDGLPLPDATAYLSSNTSNITLMINETGHAHQLVEEGSYTLHVENDDYVSNEKTFLIEEDFFYEFILLSNEESFDSNQVNTVKTNITTVVSLLKPKVILTPFENEFVSSSYVPLLFTLEGLSSRCQVLSKQSNTDGYAITQTIINPKEFNEVILTNLAEADLDFRIRCIISEDEAIVSQTRRISVINMDSDIKKLEDFQSASQTVLSKLNSFPTSFKQVFIDEIISLENAVIKSKELAKQIQISKNLLNVRIEINNLVSGTSSNMLQGLTVDSTENVIAYVDISDVDTVINYLDLSKKNVQLLSEQELFAIKTNYNFVTLTYNSGLIKKQTFVSNQVIPVDGTSIHLSFDEYLTMPSFLTSRLAETHDVLVKSYGDKSLVRLLENSSALVFDGWLDDVSLIRTVILADDQILGKTPTGFIVSDVSIPDWQIPLVSFIVLIIVVGLFFNPYFSVLNAFTKNDLDKFTSKVHECIDASLSKEHRNVIALIPPILNSHKNLSSQEKTEVSAIIKKVEELFYDSTYNLALQKISSKPAQLWSFPELKIAIKDFYGSYAELSREKQQEYLPYFNKMIAHSEQLVSQVKR